MLVLEILGYDCETVLGKGPSHSFNSPIIFQPLTMQICRLQKVVILPLLVG